LPEVATPGSDAAVEVSLRHAITVTDYMVLVYRDRHSDVIGGQWIPQPRVSALPLTGLARKILRTTGVI
jgi:hypothetical protein